MLTKTEEQRWANLKSNLFLKSQITWVNDLNVHAKSQISNPSRTSNLKSSNYKSQIKSQIFFSINRK